MSFKLSKVLGQKEKSFFSLEAFLMQQQYGKDQKCQKSLLPVPDFFGKKQSFSRCKRIRMLRSF
jgi:hypothetical protein